MGGVWSTALRRNSDMVSDIAPHGTVSSSVGMWAACACSALSHSAMEVTSRKGAWQRWYNVHSSSLDCSSQHPPQTLWWMILYLCYSHLKMPLQLSWDVVALLLLPALGNLEWSPTASHLSGGGGSLHSGQASQNVGQCCGVWQPPGRSSEEASLSAACWLLGVAWTPCPDFISVLGRRPLPFPAVSHNVSQAEQRDKDGLVFF